MKDLIIIMQNTLTNTVRFIIIPISLVMLIKGGVPV
ncbi:MAG: hypothetical protein K0Q85_1254 [Caproiciproducens sp.]|nr:hypothetical protein [Caproiciproducens sp.]